MLAAGPLHHLWVRSFDTVEELRVALLEFRETYKAKWLIERHGFSSPLTKSAWVDSVACG